MLGKRIEGLQPYGVSTDHIGTQRRATASGLHASSSFRLLTRNLLSLHLFFARRAFACRMKKKPKTECWHCCRLAALLADDRVTTYTNYTLLFPKALRSPTGPCAIRYFSAWDYGELSRRDGRNAAPRRHTVLRRASVPARYRAIARYRGSG